MRKIGIIIFLLVALFLVAYGNIQINSRSPALDYINFFLEITNYSKIEASSKNIYIYSLPAMQKSITTSLTNNDKEKTNKVKIIIEGEIKDWISLNEYNFDINSGETKNITIIINIPIDAQGNYTGDLKIESRK